MRYIAFNLAIASLIILVLPAAEVLPSALDILDPSMEWEAVDADPFDWSDWSRDIDRNGIDDMLEGDLEELEGIGGLIGINVHFDHYPSFVDLDRITSILPSLDFHHAGKYSTALYLSIPQEQLPNLGSIKGDDITMIEYRPPIKEFLDISSPATRSGRSDLYSPMTAEDLGYDGEGVVVAVIDSGVDNQLHESLRGKYVYGVDFTDTPVIEGLDPEDVDGHGTHVAGTAIGSGGSSGTYAGTAPGAELVDLRYARFQGDFTGNADRALEWIIENHEEYGIRVTSCSWGSTSPTSGRDTTSRLVNQLVDEGVVVVVAAGNDGSQGLPSPASADKALTIGALNDRSTVTRDDDSQDWYSNRGPRSSDGDLDNMDELKPDILAPGTNIRSARHNSVMDYVDMTGTSMATPHVSGIAALMLQANPDLAPQEIKEILRDTAQQKRPASVPETDDKYNYRSGWGLVDAYGAVKRAEDLRSFSVQAPSNVRQNMPFSFNVTGHFTKTGYDDQDDILRIRSFTPLTWGPPSEYDIDPGYSGAQVTLSSPEIIGGRWSVGGTVEYTAEVEDVEPVLQVELRPIGNIGDVETLEGDVSINGILDTASPTNVTISYDSLPPDLSVVTTAIWFSDNLPETGDEVDIHVKVNNTGGTDVRDVVVHFLDGPERTGTKIGEDTIDVDGFSHSIARITWEANPGLHAITVIVDPDGEVLESNEDNNSAERPITVLGVNAPPIAQLEATPTSGTTITRFQFDGSGSYDTNIRGGNVVRYNFDFGDGQSTGWVESSMVEHVYRRGGIYTASLMVEDNGGTRSQNDAEVSINVSDVQSDEKDLYLNGSMGLSIVPGQAGSIPVPASSQNVDIGTWTSEAVPATQIIHTAFILELSIHSMEEQEIEISADIDAGGEDLMEGWSILHSGGGNESFTLDMLIPETELSFTEKIELHLRGRSLVEDSQLIIGPEGTYLTLYWYFKENSLPEVDAGPDLDVKAGQQVTFEGSVIDEDSGIYSSRWDLDSDGVWEAQGDDVSTFIFEGYENEGSYTARFEVTDNDGGISFDTATITVRPSDYNYAPTVSMICPTSSLEGVFTIRGTSEDDQRVASVDVKVDGPSGPGNATVLSWSRAVGTKEWSYEYDTRGLEDGSYMVSARAFDGERYSEVISCWTYIENPNTRPVIQRILVSPLPLLLDGETPLRITADVDDPDLPTDDLLVTVNLGSLDGPDDAVMYDDGSGADSNEGDLTFSMEFIPSRTLAPGTYSFIVTATDLKGEKASATEIVELYSEVKVNVEIPDGPLTPGREYMFKVAIEDDELVQKVEMEINNSTLVLADDGRQGDKIAGDGIYSRSISLEFGGEEVGYEIRVIGPEGRILYAESGSISVEPELQSTEGGLQDGQVMLVVVVSIILVSILIILILVLVIRNSGRKKEYTPVEPDPYYGIVSGEVIVAQVIEE